MKQITKISTSVLRVHPRNTEFFDDIEGDTYTQFKKSIEEDGIITPLIISSDMTIISGHQRYQAAKDLGITQVPVLIREDLEDEDEQLKKLLATNFGRLKNNPVKQGRVYEQYEKLCGVRQGSAGSSDTKVSGGLTQADIARELGVSTDTIRNLKKLQTLSPELQQLIEDGQVKYTTALNVWGKLSNDEQKQFIEEIGAEEISTLTAKETEQYINKAKELELKNQLQEQKLNQKISELSSLEVDINRLKIELENRPTIEKEVLPSDYESSKKMLEDYRVDYKSLQKQYQDKVSEVNKIKRDLETMKENTPEEQYNKKIKDSTIFFCARISEFLEKVGGYIWIVDHINELPELEKRSYYSAVNAISAWAENLRNNIDN